MFLRISSFVASLALAACSGSGDNPVATAASDDRIECALAGASSFTRTCAVERAGGNTLILRHSDGGFRRIDIAPDGAIAASDGSDLPAGKTLPDGRFELKIGPDRYRLPPR